MRQVSVFVNDYVSKTRMGVAFTVDDFDKVEALWDEEDQRLLALQGIPTFKGYKTWAQCRSEHLRVLIVRTMAMSDEISNADRIDTSHPVTSTFHFLVLCLVRCLENASASTIEIMHINRITDKDIVFDYTAVMDMNFSQPPPLDDGDDSPFKIIVDNTK